MAFIKPLHRLFSHTSTNLLLYKTFPVAAAVKLSPTSPIFYCRTLHNIASYKLRPSLSESESDETDTDETGYTPNPWLKSGRINPCVLKDEEDVIKAKADLPGIGKSDVKVWIEKSSIRFKATENNAGGKGEAAEEDVNDDDDYDEPRQYSGAIEVPDGPYKLDEVKAEMKNGVLEIVIPKIALKERKDIKFVTVV